ncbi:hypothetical protein C8R47DRAFT_1116456 [Mycena vitilis]|nr:hypothetical protein C8R47DRAFT_1116456 [Mycena vitilis]
MGREKILEAQWQNDHTTGWIISWQPGVDCLSFKCEQRRRLSIAACLRQPTSIYALSLLPKLREDLCPPCRRSCKNVGGSHVLLRSLAMAPVEEFERTVVLYLACMFIARWNLPLPFPPDPRATSATTVLELETGPGYHAAGYVRCLSPKNLTTSQMAPAAAACHSFSLLDTNSQGADIISPN